MLSLFFSLLRKKRLVIKQKFDRKLPLGDIIFDRWENAKFYGFGSGTTVYDSCLILGNVKIGNNTWVGPNTVLDGSGGLLEIGNKCSISAGVQIYTHDTVAWATSDNGADYFKASTTVGSNVYIGPNAVIKAGVIIGDGVVIGAQAYVDKSIPSFHRAYGIPVKILPPKTKL